MQPATDTPTLRAQFNPLIRPYLMFRVGFLMTRLDTIAELLRSPPAR